MMMIAVMAIVAMTASAQNTLRDDGTFTLQPKVGLALGSFSGDYTKAAGESDPKMRTGYEISNFILDIRYNLGLTKVNKVTGSHNEKQRSDLIQFTIGYKFEL